jgi:uncharacterized membrane protein YwaF
MSMQTDLKAQGTDAMTTRSTLQRRGFLNVRRVTALAFWITTTCVLIAVVTSILAIWEFTGTDALWRTVATCVVVGIGTLTFSWINSLFGMRNE